MDHGQDKTTLADVICTIYRDQNYNKDIYQSWCKYLLDGNLIMRMGHAPRRLSYEDALKFTPETIDWNISYENVTNIAQLYLHSLEPVRILLLGYVETANTPYLDLARAIIQSWLNFDSHGAAASNEFAWYDHCVSERTVILILFYLLADGVSSGEYISTKSEVLSRLAAHADYLLDDQKYVPQNHGTMMDRALYLVSRFCDYNGEARAWRAKAISRLNQALGRDFSDNGVNLENSSSYHQFNLDLFMGIEYNVLRPFGDTLGEGTTLLIEKAIDFIVYAAQPDKRLPFWGAGAKVDLVAQLTKRSTYALIKDHPGLAYMLSDGETGNRPKELVKTYEREGYVFMRNSWEAGASPGPMFASFKAGFVLRNHKHADDLSFTLFARGQEILVDAGVYTYAPGDFHQYFVSTPAHNTVAVDGATYDFRRGDLDKVGILKTHMDRDHFSITAKNDLYKGVSITRMFVFMGGLEAIVLIDDIESNECHSYSQNFHLAHRFAHASVEQHHAGSVQTTVVSDGELRVAVGQLVPASLRVHRGKVDQAGPGLLSESFNSIRPTTSLEFNQVAEKARFITAIYTPGENDAECSLALSAGSLHVSYQGADVIFPLEEIESRLELQPRLSAQQTGANEFHFEIRGVDAKRQLEFAWYFIDENGEKEVVWYSEKKWVTKTFGKPGAYRVEYFIRSSDGAKEHHRHPDPVIVSEPPAVARHWWLFPRPPWQRQSRD